MAGRIRKADVDEVKSRTNIADIIGERVALKPAGVGSMKGLCPFHDERSPSFNVRPASGFYHCFGCGESGDVYSFLERMDHLSFAETVERLAGRIGYTLHYEDGVAARDTTGRTRLFAANTAAAEYFREQLTSDDAQTARAFLGDRGFDAGAAAHFGVGYAPRGWSGLSDHLRAQGFSQEELATAGLVAQGQRGGVYDRFRGRLVWPIRDVTGQIVGFGARRLYQDDKGPKYLNTPETTIYHKAQVLYGLDLAKRDISRSHQVVVVEGYTDVMACHLAGVTTAIATCGTAFGVDHITVLRRVMGDDSAAGEVVFTFDPDAAGTKAAMRAFGEEKRFAAQTYVAVAPDGLDPCDLRLQHGDRAVTDLMGNKVPMFEFVIDQRLQGFDLGSVEGRAGALQAAAPIVADIRDPGLRPGYIRVLARRLGLDLGEVTAAVGRYSGKESSHGRSGSTPARSSSVQTATSRQGSASQTDTSSQSDTAPPLAPSIATLPKSADTARERDALMGFLQFGHLVDASLMQRALDDPFSNPGLEAVRRAVAAAGDSRRPGWAVQTVEMVREPYRSLAAELLTGAYPAHTEEGALRSVIGVAQELIRRSLRRQKSELLGAIQRVRPESEEGRQIRTRLFQLDTELQNLLATD